MPALDLSAILDLLEPSAPDVFNAQPPRPADDAESVFRVLLSRDLGAGRATRVEAALSEGGWFEPSALAASAVSELRQFLADQRIRLGETTLTRLRRLAVWIDAVRVEDDPRPLGDGVDTATLRDSLRAVKGLGPATVDALLLHGLGRAAFPVERAGYRILARHGWVDLDAGYDDARGVVESASGGEVAFLSAIEAGFDRVGRTFCRPRRADCELCPLRTLLPAQGPVGDELD